MEAQVPDYIPGTPGGVAYRQNKRNMARPALENAPYRGDLEIREKLRSNLFTKDGEEILVVILELTKKQRTVAFAPGKTPDERLAAIGRVTIYREIVEAIFEKADLKIPEALREVLT